MMITVVNKYKHDPEPDKDVYIGRGSVFGNKYSHLNSKFPDTIKVETREEAVEKFKEFLNEQMVLRGTAKATEFVLSMEQLLELAEEQDVNLVCYCKPKACHGDVIKEWLEKEMEEKGNEEV